MAMQRSVGLVAGGGWLPRAAANAIKQSGDRVFVVVLEGHGRPEDFGDVESVVCRVGAVGTILSRLHEANVQDVCLIGTVRRPSFGQLRPDGRALKLIARYGFGRLGDDSLLRLVGDIVQGEGFRLVGVQELLQDAVIGPGPYGRLEPTQPDLQGIARGLDVAQILGRADVGQAVVVQQGMILAVEAIEGTDRLIARTPELMFPGRGPILVKACKPQQDSRLDLPTIGPTTIHQAQAAGFVGVAAEAGRTLVADPPALKAAADQAGLFVFGAENGGNKP